jgi:hypothetical protein
MRLLTSTMALLAAACALRLYKIGNALGRAADALLADSRGRL